MQSLERADPLGRELLYLPSPEMLRLSSLGNPGLVADLLYLWAIQYYAQYQPRDRFLYLEPIFDLITDLDPRYHDAYRVGALIMQLPITEEAKHKAAVIRLFDKALRHMPANHEIAEAAGWDMYIRYRDKAESIRYFEAAVAMPGAPHRLKRFLGVWQQEGEAWSFDDALSYWEEVRREARTPYDRTMSERQIYRLYAARDEERLGSVLEQWSRRFGRCPSSWQELVDAGWLDRVPEDYFGQPYRILPDECEAMGVDSVRFD
jgi:tetratricopeptide (TPR) repeat protein